jgi:hypothetical protein
MSSLIKQIKVFERVSKYLTEVYEICSAMHKRGMGGPDQGLSFTFYTIFLSQRPTEYIYKLVKGKKILVRYRVALV